MIQMRSILDIADNTGARRASMIGKIGHPSRYAHVGDIITINIKESSTDATVKKGEVVKAVIVRTRAPLRRARVRARPARPGTAERQTAPPPTRGDGAVGVAN